jgi:hypothetical protein
MSVYFDPKDKAIYVYGINYTGPTDSFVKIPKEVHLEFFLSTPPAGKELSVDENNLPCWADVGEKEVSLDERFWRNSELLRADIELNKVQDSDPKAMGTVGQWREYRKALRAWPEHKDFPSKAKRPVAPDA